VVRSLVRGGANATPQLGRGQTEKQVCRYGAADGTRVAGALRSMGRPLRWLRPNTLYFVTNRCYQRRFLLRPDPDANAIFLLALGRALRRYTGVQLKAAVTVSNHFHLLLADALAIRYQI